MMGDIIGLNKGIFDGIIVKYDNEYNRLWNKNFGGNDIDRFYYVSETSDGYIAVGNSASSDQDIDNKNIGMQDAIIVKYNKNGDVLWNRNFGTIFNDYFYGVSVKDNGYTAVGNIEDESGTSTAVIVKYDTNGNVLWNKEFGGSANDYFYSITNTNNGYMVVGSSASVDGNLEGKK